MIRKNLVIVMAALLGFSFLAATCGVALADPPFYVKINNRTDVPVDIKYNWTGMEGQDPSAHKSCTIPAMSTTKFTSPRGNPMMHVWMDTGDEEKKHFGLQGGEDPQQPAYYVIYHEGNTAGGYLRIK